MKNYVLYKRVSTDKQGISGLGLEAQDDIVKKYINGKGTIIAQFTEIESGKKGLRPELTKALDMCKKYGYTLIVAKLDRLYRNVEFTAKLLNSKIDFVCADFPDANRLTIHIISAMAEYEAQLISERTKYGLAMAKKRGVKLGKPENLTPHAQELAVEANIAKAKELNKKATGYILVLRKNNMTFGRIADKLNKEGFESSRGNMFSVKTVRDLYLRGIN